MLFFFSSRRRHTRFDCDWSSDVCSSDLGVEDGRVRRQLLDEFGIEIAGGIGPLKGKIWRIGLMGYVSQAKHILFFLAALEKVLLDQGLSVSPGAGVGAAIRLYAHAEPAAVGHRS